MTIDTFPVRADDNPDSDERASAGSLRALDWLNVFLADVRDGVGPYLAIFLLASHNWNARDIGIAMSASTLAGVIAQTPAGYLVDRLRQKRLLVAIAAALIAVGCVAMVVKTTMTVIIIGQAAVGVAAAIIAPAVAGITLGLVGHKKLDRRIGRNESFNHAGNVAAAVLAGLLGHYVGREYIFYLVALMSAASIVSISFVKGNEIDHAVASGAANEKDDDRQDSQNEQSKASGLMSLVSDKRILFFALAIILFHFANAAMLPLVGQLLADGKDTGASLYMSACIIAAQLVMIPVAAWAGAATHTHGRKKIFLIAFLVLPVRGVLYTLTGNPYLLVAIQLLDGIAAGLFGVISILMIADLTRGTGRFNLAQGAIATATGIGASLSVIVTGFIVQRAGYNAGFLTLAAVAVVALVVFWFFVPETKNDRESDTKSPTKRSMTSQPATT
ncbi:MAG: MFS transporter [Pyrinomonadaceae bacterium MAG19_C2-C3]|nr:MFS transporter [Pyrinomonadaceae bacterium MAG19_C2-C3]